MTDENFTPNADELLGYNEAAATTHDRDLPGAPSRRIAVVACMDSRIDVLTALGLQNGEAHVIRNAGGVVTDDVIRSLCLSQRSLGTREILLLHHTDCGLQKTDGAAFKAELERELGIKPSWSVEAFDDPHADVRQSMQRLRHTPFVPHTDHLRGFVYDVTTGRLDEVTE
ncbi:MAG: carbonic anhydrase [Acidimicrobiales bacterium]|nr:carbonic anhydrase [Acidimicrobiales bacterium]